MKKVSDLIVEFLISKSVGDIFGYPGGYISHFMDSISKYDNITSHCVYHEQSAAFAACGYAQAGNRIGVAYSTSGPGATNLITGIANAFFDSIPVIFFTGQCDTCSINKNPNLKQIGFQETNIVEICKPITKYSVQIDKPELVIYELEKAYQIAIKHRQGPVLIDIPSDVQRSYIDESAIRHYEKENIEEYHYIDFDNIKDFIASATKPCFLLGMGAKRSNKVGDIIKLAEDYNIPIITTLPAFDILENNHKNNFGFYGTNGTRLANYVFDKSDLLFVFGARLSIRQLGINKNNYLKNKMVIRIDSDENELKYDNYLNEIKVFSEIDNFIDSTRSLFKDCLDKFPSEKWFNHLLVVKEKTKGFDNQLPGLLLQQLSNLVPDNVLITSDVGQNMLWVARSFLIKSNQKVFMSFNLGSMGYSLPAAIGAYYASKKPVISINGDGGLMMNIQELQFIKRENIPVTIVCLNNESLGMVKSFQERNFNSNYMHTTENSGFLSPNFRKIGKAFGLKTYKITNSKSFKRTYVFNKYPQLIEMMIPQNIEQMPYCNDKNTLYVMEPSILDKWPFD